MVLSCLAFTAMGICIKLGVGTFSVAEDVFYRSGIAWLVMQCYVSLRGLSLPTVHYRAHIFRVAAGCAAMALYFASLTYLPLATAITLTNTAPLFLGVILWLVYRERVSYLSVFLLLSGFVGVILLLQPTIVPQQWPGAVMGLGAGLFTSFAVFNVRALGMLGEPEWRVVYFFSAASTLVGFLWVLFGPGFQSLSLYSGLLALGMGGFGVIGQMAMTGAYRLGNPLIAANLSYLAVVFASVFGVLYWNDFHPITAWLGMAMIVLCCVALSLLSQRQRSNGDRAVTGK